MANRNQLPEKERARFIIEHYFRQVNQGCMEQIVNHSPYCCKNPAFSRIEDPNDAAIKALELSKTYEERFLCSYLATTKEKKIDFKNLEGIVSSSIAQGRYSVIENIINDSFSLPLSIISNFKTDKVQAFDNQDYFQGLDLKDLSNIFNLLLSINHDGINNALVKSFTQLSNNLKYNAKTYNDILDLQPFVFLLINPFIHELENRNILANVCSGVSKLNPPLIIHLGRWFSNFTKDYFTSMLTNLEQFISVRILVDGINLKTKDDPIVGACALIDLLYKVNEEKFYVPYTDFYNDAINTKIDLFVDYTNWTRKTDFSFTTYPCILGTGIKSTFLQIEYTLIQKNNRSMLGAAMGLSLASDFLVFKVNRETLVTDTLALIEKNKRQLTEFKKELKIQFVGEEGIDQGGPKQEFFQLIVRKIFDPEFGMFKYNEETRCYWFRSDSRDYSEFELIGIIIGLALYNSIILDVHFPLAIFSKLLQRPNRFEDIESIDPVHYRSLVDLRNSKQDISTWGITFSVSEESYGSSIEHNLKPNGSEITVDNNNREEYIQLYTNYLLNESIAKQWSSFFKGFQMVCDSPVLSLLRPEELENLVCGVEDLNFQELQQVAKYEGGYTKNDTTIKNFWRVLNELSNDDKKKFLSFTTGSDRVPFGGLSKLDFSITKTADSDRLPSAHTCFNTLILPAYPTYEKLRDLLTKALTHCEGFGLR
ncbi:ubiquitin-protein ligase E3A [Tieghemostelium lacteum]|uniref:HECT-type E3 ubiquitin transferase n=1 Tax=Tieghemostelium lacteum TaxID=361077 RepID=A0A151ZDY8_TIELA|nr:ubiquitin-protein ligase E3A [Tieghemostelium lacteum]|eukprot:KYQ92173.1 ubiquitin-protein ligase E3A [Tieghemostelium lacteum]